MSNQADPHKRKNGEHEHLLTVIEAAAARPDQPIQNTEDVFRMFAMFMGDMERTALATNRTPEDIAEMCAAGDWNKRIAVLLRLQKSGVPGDAERGVNRAVNFVQADRLRSIIERVLRSLVNLNNHELFSLTVSTITRGRGENTSTTDVITTRPFADLATALEKCHAMTYQALADTSTDRKERKEVMDADHSATELHMKIAAGMTAAREAAKPPATLPPG